MTAPALSTRRAVGYFRVSSTGQIGEHHSSLETQEARFHEYCERESLASVATFTDVVSGRRDDRREYSQMVEYVLQGNADVIVVQFLDRFGRNPKEILQRYWQLQEHNVSIVATDEDIRDELILLIKAGIAGAESRRTSERVRANMSRVVAKGVHAARAPYGLRRVYQGRDVGWELDSLEAPIVREMYRLSVDENRGYKAIADRLTETGHRARGGRPFASHTIQRILSNEALVGTLSYGKRPRKGNPQIDIVRVPDFFPAVLSGGEWRLLQERLAIRRESKRGKAHTSPYLLSSIIKCGNCGGPMVGKTGMMWRGQRYRNYYCSWAMRSRGLCTTYNGNSARKLDAAILEYLAQFSDPELVREHMAAAERKEIDGRQKELKVVERGLSDLESQFLKHLDLLKRGVINEEEFVKANESMRTRKTALEERQAELSSWLEVQRSRVSSAEAMPQAIRTFLDDFQNMEIHVQKANLQLILKAAHVHRDGKIELEFRA